MEKGVKIDGRWAKRYEGEWVTPEEQRELMGEEGRRWTGIIAAICMAVALLVILTPPLPW